MKNLSKTSGFCLLVDSFRYLRVLIYIYIHMFLYDYSMFVPSVPTLHQTSRDGTSWPQFQGSHAEAIVSLQFFLRAKDTAWQKNIMDRLMFIDVRGEKNIGFIVQNAVRLPRIYSCCA